MTFGKIEWRARLFPERIPFISPPSQIHTGLYPSRLDYEGKLGSRN